MRVSVFGLGYVGTVAAACLAEAGHLVTGVDVNANKVASVNQGLSPVVEPGLAELICEVVACGRLRGTTSVQEAVDATELSLVCVGTPSLPTGDVNLTFISRVCSEIGSALAVKGVGHVVAIRSTLLPGYTEATVIPAMEKSSALKAGQDFHVVYNPEFLREGTALKDYVTPSRTVIGEDGGAAGKLVVQLYADINAPIVRTSIRTAEMIKYVDNAFHALKVAFSNEIAALCHAHGIDGHEVMRVFRMDKRLNLSEAYLRPGHAFGGSCLPKDLRALTNLARRTSVEHPLLESILRSNEVHKRRCLELVLDIGARSVAVMGLSFKAQTDDLRESPAVELVEAIIGKGLAVSIYDPYITIGELKGSNKEYIDRYLPHIARLLCPTPQEALERATVAIYTSLDRAYEHSLCLVRSDQTVIDLVGIVADPGQGPYRYIGAKMACQESLEWEPGHIPESCGLFNAKITESAETS